MFGTDDLGIVCGSCIHLWKLVLLFSTCPSMKLGFALGDIWNGFVSPLSPCECNLAAVLHFGSIKTWLRCLVAVHKYTMHLPGRRRGHYGNAELPQHWEQNNNEFQGRFICENVRKLNSLMSQFTAVSARLPAPFWSTACNLAWVGVRVLWVGRWFWCLLSGVGGRGGSL